MITVEILSLLWLILRVLLVVETRRVMYLFDSEYLFQIHGH